LELARRADHAHALAATTRRWLDEDRVADALRLAQGVQVVAQHPLRPRDRRQPVVGEELAGPGTAAESREDLGSRPDERQVVVLYDLGEALVLREKAVTRVDRVATGDQGRR